ncbi:MAG TPA: PRC-barrel domain-containing protein [Burkholderiales bacterium]
MERTIKGLQGDDIVATDGAIGSVRDVFFDDERWGVRYLVVDTSTWLPGRKVLISPASVDAERSAQETLSVRLTREQVKNAPGVDADRPVSRQSEMAHAAHFGYPYYWSGPLLWGAAAYPTSPVAAGSVGAMGPRQAAAERSAQEQLAQGDSHLRSGAEVIGYEIEAKDGEIGEVEDFVVDARSWGINGVVIDTRKWWPGGQVRIAPDEVESIDWKARKMRLRLTREQIKAA